MDCCLAISTRRLEISMSDFLPFALPDTGEEEIVEVADSIRSGWLTTGPKTKRFEQDFAAFIGGGVEAIAVNSATSGLHMALEAVGDSSVDLTAKPLSFPRCSLHPE